MKKLSFQKNKKYVIPVLFTPCSRSGIIDCKATEDYCKMLSDKGCDGIFVVGSTGCMPLLDESDRIKIVSSAYNGKSDNVVLLAGISGTGAKDAIINSKLMADNGADVAVIMAPFFLNLNQQQLYAYICEIADNSPIPLFIYNHIRMPTIFEVETVSRLMKHTNIVGMKDTGLDMEKQKQIIESATDEEFLVFQGHERLILDSLQTGADGCMTALASIVPDWHKKLIDAYLSQDIQLAKTFQNKLTNFTETMLMDKEVRQSWGHFEYSLKYCAQKIGLLKKKASYIKGWDVTSQFDCHLNSIINKIGLLD